MSAFNAENPTGASQLASLLAQRAGPGFSKDPADYQPTKIRISGAAFNPVDPKYRPELDPLGLIGDVAVAPEGVPVVICGSLSGVQERDRVTSNGRETTRLHAIWRVQPDATPVKGKGGGLKTDRGGWIADKIDEIFLLTPYGLAVLTLYDQHHVVAGLTRRATSLGVGALFEVKWQLVKASVIDDGGYKHDEPRFELLGVVGEVNGPTETEIKLAKKLTSLIDRLSHPHPGIPLKLVVNSTPMGEPPTPPPPPNSEHDYGADRDGLPDFLK